MEKKLTISLIAAVLALAWTNLPAQTQRDFLKTDGIYIRDQGGTGDTVFWYGTNLGGCLVHEPWMSPLSGANSEYAARNILQDRFGEEKMRELMAAYHRNWITENDFRFMAEHGVNCVRLPVYFGEIMRNDGSFFEDADGRFAFMDWCVETARKYGMWTLIDLHGAPGSQNGADHSGRTEGAQLYDSDVYKKMCVDVWKAIATHYKGNSAVCGYDLLNEPSRNFPSNMGDEVVPVYEMLYDAIRAIDPDHIIVMEAIWNWNLLPDPATKGWTNVMYQTHHYAWGADRTTMINSMNGHINDIKNLWSRYKVPHLIGEFTIFGGPWLECLSALVENNMNWTTWTLKLTQNNSHWGMLNYKGGAAKPHMTNDSYEQIMQKWTNWDSERYFQPYALVCDAFNTATRLRGEPRRPDTSVEPTIPRITGQPQSLSVAENGTATFSVRAEGYPLKYEWMRGDKPITGATSAQLVIPAVEVKDDGARFSVRVYNDLGTVVSSPAVLTVVPFTGPFIRRFAAAPVIDGTVDNIWFEQDSVNCARILMGGANLSAADLSAVVRTGWDATSLYLLFEVTDDVVGTGATQPWDNDGVEIYLDMDYSRGNSYAGDDVQFRILRGATSAVFDHGGSVSGMVIRQAQRSNGYTIELSIPWSSLGGAAAAESFAGIDFHVNDNDGTARDAKRTWFDATDNAWRSPAAFGSMKVVGLNYSVVHPQQTLRQAGIPMGLGVQASRIVLDGGLPGTFDVRIVSVTGRQVVFARGVRSGWSIDCGSLSRGLYVAHVSGVQGSAVMNLMMP